MLGYDCLIVIQGRGVFAVKCGTCPRGSLHYMWYLLIIFEFYSTPHILLLATGSNQYVRLTQRSNSWPFLISIGHRYTLYIDHLFVLCNSQPKKRNSYIPHAMHDSPHWHVLWPLTSSNLQPPLQPYSILTSDTIAPATLTLTQS